VIYSPFMVNILRCSQ